MNEIIKLILSLSLSGSILAVIIFLLKSFIKHKLPKSIQYYIWVVVLLRLMLPFSFETSIMNGVFYGNNTSMLISPQNPENVTVDNGNAISAGETDSNDNTMSPGEIAGSVSILPATEENAPSEINNGGTGYARFLNNLFSLYTLYIWLLGAIIALATNLIGYARFLKCLKPANKPASDDENRMLISLSSGRHNVELVRNPFIATPMLIGIFKPLIIIPDTKFNEVQLKNILLHEITHLKRFDIGVKWFMMIITSIHWFNPLIYFMKKEINHACELACDEAVIKNLSANDKQVYGDTLISVVFESKYPIGVLQATMSEDKKTMKERLVAIMKHSKKSKVIMLLSGVLFLLIIFCAISLGAGVGFRKDSSAVDMPTYDLEEISKYQTPYVGDNSKVSAIANLLPTSDSHFKQRFISMKTAEKPYGLTVYYETTSGNYEGSWPITTDSAEKNSQKNALVLFSMIDNLDEVTFAFRNSQSDGKLDTSKYDKPFTFQRSSIEEEYGNISSLAKDLNLLQDKLEDKISAFKGLDLYVWKKPELTGNDNLYYTLLMGTNINKMKSEVFNLDTATSDLSVIKNELSRYSSGTYLFIMHSFDIDKDVMEKVGDELSAVIKNGNISIGGVDFDELLGGTDLPNEPSTTD